MAYLSFFKSADVATVANCLVLQKSTVQKMECITCELGAMLELEQYQQRNASTDTQAVFEACNIAAFC